jgi:plastocyanin
VNRDSVKHTATKGGSFTTGKIKPGHAVAIRFGSKGTYRYQCTLHPDMHGKIVVD